MRLSADGTQLLQSQDPQLEPWLPSRQFGWLVTHDSILQRFFQPLTAKSLKVDFDQYFVLALIRYDQYPWRFDVEQINLAPNAPLIELSYTLVPVGRRHKDPLLSTQLILVKKTPELLRLGVTNIPFKLKEVLDINDPDIPVFGENEDELIFPTAYTLKEILLKQD